MRTQQQFYRESTNNYFELIKDVGFLCGLYGKNKNPLTEKEILAAANSGKPYAHIFQSIAKAKSLKGVKN